MYVSHLPSDCTLARSLLGPCGPIAVGGVRVVGVPGVPVLGVVVENVGVALLSVFVGVGGVPVFGVVVGVPLPPEIIGVNITELSVVCLLYIHTCILYARPCIACQAILYLTLYISYIHVCALYF